MLLWYFNYANYSLYFCVNSRSAHSEQTFFCTWGSRVAIEIKRRLRHIALRFYVNKLRKMLRWKHLENVHFKNYAYVNSTGQKLSHSHSNWYSNSLASLVKKINFQCLKRIFNQFNLSPSTLAQLLLAYFAN